MQRILAWMRSAHELTAARQIRAHRDLWSVLGPYLHATASTGCNYLDYWELYRCIRRYGPREVLECGTGASTVVIAWALQQNASEGRPGRVTSLEELEEYFDRARAIFPASLAEYVDFRLSPPTEDRFGLFRGVRYRDLPNRPYDFVFVDGPNYRAPEDGALTFDFDFIHVLRSSDAEVRGLVDKRVSTRYVLQQVLGAHKVFYDARKHLGFIEACTRHDLRTLPEDAPSRTFATSFRLFGNSRLSL